MAGITCQCGSLAADVCPKCKANPLCEECKQEYDACEECTDDGDTEDEDPFGYDDEDGDDGDDGDDEDDD